MLIVSKLTSIFLTRAKNCFTLQNETKMSEKRIQTSHLELKTSLSSCTNDVWHSLQTDCFQQLSQGERGRIHVGHCGKQTRPPQALLAVLRLKQLHFIKVFYHLSGRWRHKLPCRHVIYDPYTWFYPHYNANYYKGATGSQVSTLERRSCIYVLRVLPLSLE